MFHLKHKGSLSDHAFALVLWGWGLGCLFVLLIAVGLLLKYFEEAVLFCHFLLQCFVFEASLNVILTLYLSLLSNINEQIYGCCFVEGWVALRSFIWNLVMIKRFLSVAEIRNDFPLQLFPCFELLSKSALWRVAHDKREAPVMMWVIGVSTLPLAWWLLLPCSHIGELCSKRMVWASLTASALRLSLTTWEGDWDIVCGDCLCAQILVLYGFDNQNAHLRKIAM